MINHMGHRNKLANRQSKQRVSLFSILVLGLAAVCLVVSVIAMIETVSGQTLRAHAKVIDRGTILAGKIPVSAAVVQIQSGAYRHRVIKVSDNRKFRPGDTVYVSFSVGIITGELHASDIAPRVVDRAGLALNDHKY